MIQEGSCGFLILGSYNSNIPDFKVAGVFNYREVVVGIAAKIGNLFEMIGGIQQTRFTLELDVVGRISLFLDGLQEESGNVVSLKSKLSGFSAKLRLEIIHKKRYRGKGVVDKIVGEEPQVHIVQVLRLNALQTSEFLKSNEDQGIFL